MPPLQGAFVADFGSFTDACAKAEVSLTGFESGANKVEGQLNRLSDSLSGTKIIQQATIAAEAVTRLGGEGGIAAGLLQLTDTQLAKIGATAQEAEAKLVAMGQNVPPGIQKIADATKDIGTSATATSTELGAFEHLLERITERVVIYDALRHVFDFGKEILSSAVALQDMSEKTDLSTTTLQQMQFVAGQTGSTLEKFSGDAFTMGVNIQAGGAKVQDAADRMHLSLAALQAMNADDQWNAIVHGLESITDAQTRNLAGTELFGKGAKDIMASIAKGYTSLASEAVVSGDAQIKALKDASDAWDRFYQNTKNRITQFIGDDLLLQNAVKTLTDEQKTFAFETTNTIADFQAAEIRAAAGGKDVNLTLPKPINDPAADKAQAAIDAAKAAFDNDVAGLMDKLGGGAVTKQIAELADAFVSLGGSSKLSGQQLMAFADAAMKLRAEGGTLPPVLTNIVQVQDAITASLLKMSDRIGVTSGVSKDFFSTLSGMSKGAQADMELWLGNEMAQRAVDMDAAFTKLQASGLATGDRLEAAAKSAGEFQAAGGKLTSQLYTLAITMGTLNAQKVTDGLPTNYFKEMGTIDIPKITVAVNDWDKALKSVGQDFSLLSGESSGFLKDVFADLSKLVKGFEEASAAGKQLGIDGKAIGETFGIASPLFSDDATDAEQWAAAVKSSATIASGAMNAWTNSANAGSTASGALKGAMSGAEAGAAFGPWGAAIGAAGGALLGFIHNLNAGRDAVVAFATAQGGFDALHAQLDALPTGVGETLWKNLTQGVGSSNPAQAKAAIDAITAAINQVAVAQQQLDTATGQVATGFNEIAAGFTAPFLAANAVLNDASGSTDKLYEKQQALIASITDLTAKGQLNATQTNTLRKDREDLALVTWQLGQAQGSVADSNALLTASLPDLQDGFDRMGRLASIAFETAIADGKGLLGALDAIGPGLDQLSATMTNFGLTATGTAADLLQFRQFATDNKELAASIDGINQMMAGLNNSGLLTQSTFDDLLATTEDTFNKITEQGLSGDQALQLMQPTLQTIWEEQQEFGLQVDDTTQALLDQAVASGEVGEKHKDAMLQVADGIQRIGDILATVFGNELPKDLQLAVDGATNVGKAIKDIPTNVDVAVHYNSDGTLPDPLGEPPLPKHGTGGHFDKPHAAVIGDKPEYVTPDSAIGALAQDIVRAGGALYRGPASSTQAAPVRVTSILQVDGVELARAVTIHQPGVLLGAGR